MHVAARPYLAASVALLGASTIAISPVVVPVTPQMHLPVALTAAIENPMTVFAPMATAAQRLYSTVQDTLTTPDPVAAQLTANAIASAKIFAADPIGTTNQAINNALALVQQFGPNLDNLKTVSASAGAALSTALNTLIAGLPAALQAAGAALKAGNPNGAIDAIVGPGVQPIIDIMLNSLTPEINAIGKLVGIPQPLLDATANAALGLLVNVASATVGLGFDVYDPQHPETTPPPLLKQFFTSLKQVQVGLASGDFGTFINSIQHSIADFNTAALDQATNFITGMRYIQTTFADALKQIAPQPVAATAAATKALSVTRLTLAPAPVAAIAPATAEAAESAAATSGAPTEKPAATEVKAADAEATGTPATPAVAEQPSADATVKTADVEAAKSTTAETAAASDAPAKVKTPAKAGKPNSAKDPSRRAVKRAPAKKSADPSSHSADK